jgi:filamentous hemagglutinin family protein
MNPIDPTQPKNRAGRFARKTVAVCVTLAFGSHAWALPTGGAVSAGGATITSGAGTTTVNQATQNTAINWQSFSIGQAEAVRFVQPNSSSVALNRVLGSDPSSILGSLSANGKVFLLNPNGILFGQGAQVNVGGLVASTLNLSDAEFMAGKYKFSGTSNAAVTNQGSINADGGYVALLGATVSNQGVISARMGTVVLAAGSAMTLDVAGDGLLNVTVDQGVVNALVQNGGLIRADGGQVLLSAQGAGTLLQTVVNNTGVIQAQTLENHNGTIKLLGDMQTGSVNVGGTLDASAPNGGNGGFIETSAAHVSVADNARISTLAPLGLMGTWLIDPQDFIIGAGGNISGATLSAQLVNTSINITTAAGVGNGDIFVNDAVAWTAAGVPTTLSLNAFRDVNVNQAISATNGSLSVCCGRDINVNAAITTVNGSVLLSAGRNLNLLAALTTTDGNITACAGHDLTVGLAGAITLTRGSSIPSQSLGLPLGLVMSAGTDGTGPGPAGGTLSFVPGAPLAAVTGPNAPVTINYNPVSYTTPTDYSTKFTLVNSTLTQQMLVFPDGGDKAFDGTTATTFSTLKGLPAGVTLVAGPGSSANFDTADVGLNKTISFTGYTLAGANAGNFALATSCCAPIVSRTLGNITPIAPLVAVAPLVATVAPVVVPAVLVAEGQEAPPFQMLAEQVPEYVFSPINLTVREAGVQRVSLVQPPAPVVLVPVQQPVLFVPPQPVAPKVFVAPVRPRKQDRN